jgi:hypothetical protein
MEIDDAGELPIWATVQLAESKLIADELALGGLGVLERFLTCIECFPYLAGSLRVLSVVLSGCLPWGIHIFSCLAISDWYWMEYVVKWAIYKD